MYRTHTCHRIEGIDNSSTRIHRKAQWSLLCRTPIFVRRAHYLHGHPCKEIDENQSPIT